MSSLIRMSFVICVLAGLATFAGPSPQEAAAAALQVGRLFEVMLHVAEGADVNFRYEGDTTLLHMAAVVPDAGWLIEELVAAGADVHAQARSTRSTPLHLAALWGRPENVRALLDAGASREQRDGRGMTPLDRAWQGRVVVGGDGEPGGGRFEEVIEVLERWR